MENASFTACQQNGKVLEAAMNSARQADFKANFTVMLVAFLLGIFLMGLKFCGYWITGSSAILSDALESIINVVASGFGLGSVVLSARPPDETHPYGHGKIEFFSAGFEGALILLAAAGIFFQGMKQILNPQDLPQLGTGLFFLVAACLGNLVMGLMELRIGKRTKSLVLEADGKHLLTDVYTSGMVLVGLLLVYLTGWFRFDGIIACLAGINIVFWVPNSLARDLASSCTPPILNCWTKSVTFCRTTRKTFGLIFTDSGPGDPARGSTPIFT